MRVLIGCETSGRVREAFRLLGHDAWSCDLLPADDDSQHHMQCDVRDAIRRGPWDLGIFHPPCTRLTNSGVRWLAERDLWFEMADAARLFLDCLNAEIPRIAVENPIPHGHAMGLIKVPYTQIIQPWQHGHGETKATCLWLKGLPPYCLPKLLRAESLESTSCHPAKTDGRSAAKRYQALPMQWRPSGDALCLTL